jgi:hypothetical protein
LEVTGSAPYLASPPEKQSGFDHLRFTPRISRQLLPAAQRWNQTRDALGSSFNTGIFPGGGERNHEKPGQKTDIYFAQLEP